MKLARVGVLAAAILAVATVAWVQRPAQAAHSFESRPPQFVCRERATAEW